MRSALFLLALLGLCLPSLGQGEDKAEAEFRVTRFDPADRESPEFEVGPPEDRIEVMVPLTYIAGPHKAGLRDGRFLDFWRGEGKKPELSVELLEAERKNLLLFFIPLEDSFKVLKVNTPLNRIGGGDRYMINATTYPLAIKLGEGKPISIAPGKAGLVKAPPGQDPVSLPVLISLKKEGEWELASTEQWLCDPRFRKFLFAYTSPRTKHLAFHGVSERL